MWRVGGGVHCTELFEERGKLVELHGAPRVCLCSLVKS
jgi:hypothetical protein